LRQNLEAPFLLLVRSQTVPIPFLIYRRRTVPVPQIGSNWEQIVINRPFYSSAASRSASAEVARQAMSGKIAAAVEAANRTERKTREMAEPLEKREVVLQIVCDKNEQRRCSPPTVGDTQNTAAETPSSDSPKDGPK